MSPKAFAWISASGAVLIAAVACSSPQTAAPPAKPAAPAPDFRLVATIKDTMDGIVDPSADYLWDSVATIVTRKGIEERRPRTDEDWKQVRRRAMELILVP